MLLKRGGIELAAGAVAGSICRDSIEVKGHDDIAHVASTPLLIPSIGDLIADVMDKAGKDGVITVDFLRWLREKEARQKRLGQEEITQADRAISKALMVWANDGGATGQFNPQGNTIEQDLIMEYNSNQSVVTRGK